MNPKSTKGHATKSRILEAAISLIYERGANGTSVDDILTASGTGKSQFYHYFRNKDQLLTEVVVIQGSQFPGKDLARFNFSSSDGISLWLTSIRADFAKGNYKHGCPVGNLASEFSNGPAELKNAINSAFNTWESSLSRGLRTQKARGLLKQTTDTNEIASFIVGAIEGALLLAKTSESIGYLDAAINQINSFLKLNSVGLSTSRAIPRPTSLGFCP